MELRISGYIIFDYLSTPFANCKIMEQLSLHIEYLLLRHDCVIVPGFGAFIATRRSAVLDTAHHRVLPPTREIGFNRAVMSDDGLLAHSISRREGISFEDGRALMLRSIELLKEQLVADGEVTLGHVGTLSLGEENTILFHPYRRDTSLAMAMGMHPAPMIQKGAHDNVATPLAIASIKTPEISEEATSANATYALNDETSHSKTGKYSASDTEESTKEAEKIDDDLSSSEDTIRSSYYTFRIRKSAAHAAAGLLLMIAVVISFLLPSSDNQEKERCLASVVPVEKIAKTVSEATISSTPPASPETEQTHAPEETATVKEELEPYYLIVATFRTREEAERYIGKSDDAEKMICVDSGKLSRVAIATAKNKETLQGRLNDNSFKKKYPGSWIWASR